MSIGGTYLVTGASRGVGFALVEDLLSRANTFKVFAGVRSLSTSTVLRVLSKSDPRLFIVELEVDNEDSIKVCALSFGCIKSSDFMMGQTAVGQISANTTYLTVVINNAGYAPEKTIPAALVPSTDILAAFRTNTLGSILVIQAVLPLLRKAPAGGLVVNISWEYRGRYWTPTCIFHQ